MKGSIMKGLIKPSILVVMLGLLLSALTPRPASALSMSLPSPELNFPAGKSPQWAPTVLHALSEPQAHYLGGLVSYWPPKWATTLHYNGDTAALNSLLATLSQAKGLHLAVSFTHSTAPNASPGSWTVEYSWVTPDRIALLINLNSPSIDLTQLKLPEYHTNATSTNATSTEVK